jgi:hypothetical protein
MELTTWQKWILLTPPVVVLGGTIVIATTLKFMSGDLDWLFPVGDRPIPAVNEVVMSPGMQIIVKMPTDEMTITAGKGRKRSYTWKGDTRSVEMTPRDKRWFGSFGLYFPGAGNHWFPHDGVTRCVAEEGQLNFSSVEKAKKWLSETPAFQPRVHRNDGLTVWLKKNQCLGVDVIQVYIKGKKPSSLPGSQGDKIRVVGGGPISDTTRAPEDAYFLETEAAIKETAEMSKRRQQRNKKP